LPTTMSYHTKSCPPNTESGYIIDLRFSPLLTRLRNPPPDRPNTQEASLPMPNTTPWPLPSGVRMLIRARVQIRRRADEVPMNIGDSGGGANGDTSRRIPGSIDTRDP
jgi:hypothetical protein